MPPIALPEDSILHKVLQVKIFSEKIYLYDKIPIEKDMAIENRLPQKQKAQGGISTLGLISIEEVTGLCRLHHNRVAVKAPARVSAPTGATIRTAEAAQTRNLIMWLSTADLKRRFRDGMPQLPDRRQESRKAPRRATALPLFAVR
jgi:hypothetical protein